MTLVSVDTFRAEARANRKPAGGVFRITAGEPKAFEDGSRKVRFCFSDESVDRMGDTIAVDGWDVADFVRNPVALWAHDSSSPPIGRASDVGPEGQRLMGTIEFADAETYAFADTIYRMVVGKFIKACSVGFLPTEYSFVENDPDRGWGIDFKRQQLLEISVCPIPANGNALAEARAKGIDLRPLVEWAEKLLDGGGKVMIPKAELQRLRKAAKEPTMAPKPAKPAAGTKADDDKPVGDCGRDKDETCGMTDPSECSVHAGSKAADTPDDDDEKAIKHLRRLLRLAVRSDDDPSGDEPPIAHEDAIRMAHKCLRTAKAFQAEAMGHYSKAMDHLDGVVDALDEAPEDDKSEGNPDPDPDEDPDSEKAIRRRRAEAAARRNRLTAV